MKSLRKLLSKVFVRIVDAQRNKEPNKETRKETKRETRIRY
jgi:hypothetical protein